MTSWLTAAAPMENPECSCKLTRAPHNADCPPTEWPGSPRIAVQRAPWASNGPNHLGLLPAGEGAGGAPGVHRGTGPPDALTAAVRDTHNMDYLPT